MQLNTSTIAERCQVTPDAVRKAISRLGQNTANPDYIVVLEYLSSPHHSRSQETINGALELLKLMRPESAHQDTDLEVPNAANPETDTPDTDMPDEPETDTPEVDTPEQDKPETDTPDTDKPELDTVTLKPNALDKPKPGKMVSFLRKDTFLAILLIVLSIATACAITAPIFVAVKIPWIWAYTIAIGVDMAAFIFIFRGRHGLGSFFAVSTGIQAAIACGVLYAVPADIVLALKAGVVAVSIGLAIYGFADLIKSEL